MVGYAVIGYRLWNQEQKEFVIGRDVIFDETKTGLLEEGQSNVSDDSDE